jgi:hypothetical protein
VLGPFQSQKTWLLRIAVVDARAIPLHQRLRLQRRCEAELRIQTMCVTRRQTEAPKILQVQVRQDGTQDGLAVSVTSVARQDESIQKVCEGG